MNTLRAFKQRLSLALRLWEERQYDKALAEVETLLTTWHGNPQLHVLRASLLQLQEEPQYELEEAKQSLQQAIELDKGSPAAAIELGHFLDNVEDDPQGAVKAYADGVAAARHLLIDGLLGQAKAYRQLEKREAFFRCLQEVLTLARFDELQGPYAEQVQELLAELVIER